MRLTLAQRREILASMPWVAVTRAPRGLRRPCDGHRNMPGYARSMPPEERRRLFGCKNKGRWVFVSLGGEIEVYCWWHLFGHGFYSTPEEADRYQRWVENYVATHPDPPDWDPDAPDEPLSQR